MDILESTRQTEMDLYHIKDEALSSIPELTVPDFESQIPSHLGATLSPEMLYLMTEINMINQKQDYLIRVACDSNLQVRRTNGKVLRLQDWQRRATADLKYVEHTLVDLQSTQEDLGRIANWAKRVSGGWRGLVFVGALLAATIASSVGIIKIVEFFRH